VPLADRVAIVTGAAKPDSIGYAVAVGLAAEGADVVVADLYEAGFPEVTRAVEAAGRLRVGRDDRRERRPALRGLTRAREYVRLAAPTPTIGN
jgi:NAD(P)-dependent dehydrogenase (short-subunit alcohol dehydrogenase family)